MFEEQKSICTVCGHRHQLTSHHKIRRVDGGPNAQWNLVGVCRPCHDLIHGFKGKDGGCKQYPDLIAAAIACDAHWDRITQYWKHVGWLDHFDRVQENVRACKVVHDPRYRGKSIYAVDEPTFFANILCHALRPTADLR